MAPGSWCGHPKEKWSNISMMLRPLRPWANGGSCGLCTQDVLTSLERHTRIGMASRETRLRPGAWSLMLRMEGKVFFLLWAVGACESLQPLQPFLGSTLVPPPGDLVLQTHPQSRGFSSPGAGLQSPECSRMGLLKYASVFKLCESHGFRFLCDLWILRFLDPIPTGFKHCVWRGQWTRGG